MNINLSIIITSVISLLIGIVIGEPLKSFIKGEYCKKRRLKVEQKYYENIMKCLKKEGSHKTEPQIILHHSNLRKKND